jgi:hypothetical protein
MLYQPKKMFAGHTKVFGGPYVARGPDVTQAWSRETFANEFLDNLGFHLIAKYEVVGLI